MEIAIYAKALAPPDPVPVSGRGGQALWVPEQLRFSFIRNQKREIHHETINQKMR
jgi:hypothetical protein